ncbi:MAG TPA: trigger factor [Gemmatimonadaceae bacterium]|nr:trigger factor [Gemmatimonadaceae bacterium]
MDIEVLSRKSEGAERRLQISVSAERVATARERAARRVAQQVRLPGFRPGKAPPAVVRKKFADEIKQEALDALMREAYQSVLEAEQLEPVTQPHAHDVKFEEGQALTFELHCEVKPTVALERLAGFRVKRPAPRVTDEMVNEQLAQLREQRATWAPVDEKPREGDMVTVVLATAGEDGTMPPGDEYRLVVGAGQAIVSIEEVITELAPGGTIERAVKWPDDFPDEAQRGKSKTVRITLNEVKRKALPPLDDALARELGDFDSLEALTRTVRADLQETADREADAAVRGALMDEIIGANAFGVPPTWVRSLVTAYADAYKVPEQEREKFAGEFQSMAERQVRRDLVVETIATREKFAATEKDVDDRVTEMAVKRGGDPGKLYAALQKANRLREIERGITEDRVFEYLLSKSTVEQQ